jgi:phospholipid/cholesterol/gamma-HCH transport system substrate-binding protein
MTAAAREVLARLNSFLAENQSSLKNSIKNIETFTDTLSRNSDKIESSIKGVQSFSEALGRNAERVDSIMAGVDNLIGGPEGKGEIPAAVRAIKTAAENLDKRIDALVVDGRRTLNTIERTVNNFDKNPQRILFGGSSSDSNAPPPSGPVRRAR